MNTPASTRKRKLLVFLAGIATSPDFLQPICYKMTERFEQSDSFVRTLILYPYGDWSRHLVKQLREIRHDLKCSRKDVTRSIGGNRALKDVLEQYQGEQIILFGHSGGGVAGVHAAYLMTKQGLPTPHLIMFGSPKCAIPESLKSKVLYIYAKNSKGRNADPVTRIGSWGAWMNTKDGAWRWDRLGKAPSSIMGAPIIGGHADYFRHHRLYTNEQGESNLEIVTNLVMSWMGEQTMKIEK